MSILSRLANPLRAALNPTMSWDSARRNALDDFNESLGNVVEVTEIHGFEGSDFQTWRLPPFRVRIVSTLEIDILNTHDDWIDPYWSVELVDHPSPLSHARGFWIDGPSYHFSR